MDVLGLDIGGANLKAAHSCGTARVQPFELWKQRAALPGALAALIEAMPPWDRLAVTMTGELCDCFETKREGVQTILDAAEKVAGGKRVVVWLTDGRLVEMGEARRNPLLAAASNWLALATFAGRHAACGPAVLIDIGSTTTDIVPLVDGRPVPRGRTDSERLKCQELVYTGVRRTPVCALGVPGVSAELFATTLDVYLLREQIPEDTTDCATADGRPATRPFAHVRMARMLGGDGETCDRKETRDLANRAAAVQQVVVGRALHKVCSTLPGPPRAVLLSGSGEFLSRLSLSSSAGIGSPPVFSLAEALGPDISQAAPAFALAVLAKTAVPPCEGR
jgi:(4-(4-[2-(gamma-L-glutamylamino)ethyl]phenoxymethyl)furan-2-yl)methanamine synthase